MIYLRICFLFGESEGLDSPAITMVFWLSLAFWFMLTVQLKNWNDVEAGGINEKLGVINLGSLEESCFQ